MPLSLSCYSVWDDIERHTDELALVTRLIDDHEALASIHVCSFLFSGPLMPSEFSRSSPLAQLRSRESIQQSLRPEKKVGLRVGDMFQW